MNPLKLRYVIFSTAKDVLLTDIGSTKHPIVRQHPVTGEKALYVNPGFTRRIVGFKDEESEYLLKFLFDHIAKAADYHVRAPYEPGTVVVWVSVPPISICFEEGSLYLITRITV